MEQVDILDPSTFERTGITLPIVEAWQKGEWIPSFNLWITQKCHGSSYLLYQKRISRARWAPGMLDVTVGGHYHAGESIEDGIREVREEIGKNYEYNELTYLGRKVYLNNSNGLKRRYVVDVFIVEDSSELRSFTLQEDELEGLFRCSLDDLLRVHTIPNYSFVAEGMVIEGNELIDGTTIVTREKFPFNWDNYHYKMAVLAKRFLLREEPLFY